MIAKALVDAYSHALQAGKPLAPESEQSLYVLHESALAELLALLESGAPREVASLVTSERRSFGWSFLSGAHGGRVESAFHALASHLEATYA